eukprot:Filipodium_phascolosomae@DN8140_c0_g1_i1.p1
MATLETQKGLFYVLHDILQHLFLCDQSLMRKWSGAVLHTCKRIGPHIAMMPESFQAAVLATISTWEENNVFPALEIQNLRRLFTSDFETAVKLCVSSQEAKSAHSEEERGSHRNDGNVQLDGTATATTGSNGSRGLKSDSSSESGSSGSSAEWKHQRSIQKHKTEHYLLLKLQQAAASRFYSSRYTQVNHEVDSSHLTIAGASTLSNDQAEKTLHQLIALERCTQKEIAICMVAREAICKYASETMQELSALGQAVESTPSVSGSASGSGSGGGSGSTSASTSE